MRMVVNKKDGGYMEISGVVKYVFINGELVE